MNCSWNCDVREICAHGWNRKWTKFCLFFEILPIFVNTRKYFKRKLFQKIRQWTTATDNIDLMELGLPFKANHQIQISHQIHMGQTVPSREGHLVLTLDLRDPDSSSLQTLDLQDNRPDFNSHSVPDTVHLIDLRVIGGTNFIRTDFGVQMTIDDSQAQDKYAFLFLLFNYIF